MKPLYFLLFLLPLACRQPETPAAQPSEVIEFEWLVDVPGLQIAADAILFDNFLYIIGSVANDSVGGQTNVLLMKINLNGELVWMQEYGGTATDRGSRIHLAGDGNLLLLGSSRSKGSGQEDIFLIKTDPQGTVLWERTYGGPMPDTPGDLLLLKSGEIMVAGTTESYGSGARDMYLLRLDANGQLLDQHTYGGVDIDGASRIFESGKDTFLLYGYTKNFGAFDRDLYLMKVDLNGDSLKAIRLMRDGYQEPGDILALDGGYLICAHSAEQDPDHDLLAMAVDHEGNQLWFQLFGGMSHDGGEKLLLNSRGQGVFLGRSNSFGDGQESILMVVTDIEGHRIKDESFSGDGANQPATIIQSEHHYYIVGHEFSETSNEANILLIKRSI